jgi:hypothetical protein
VGESHERVEHAVTRQGKRHRQPARDRCDDCGAHHTADLVLRDGKPPEGPQVGSTHLVD